MAVVRALVPVDTALPLVDNISPIPIRMYILNIYDLPVSICFTKVL